MSVSAGWQERRVALLQCCSAAVLVACIVQRLSGVLKTTSQVCSEAFSEDILPVLIKISVWFRPCQFWKSFLEVKDLHPPLEYRLGWVGGGRRRGRTPVTSTPPRQLRSGLCRLSSGGPDDSSVWPPPGRCRKTFLTFPPSPCGSLGLLSRPAHSSSAA